MASAEKWEWSLYSQRYRRWYIRRRPQSTHYSVHLLTGVLKCKTEALAVRILHFPLVEKWLCHFWISPNVSEIYCISYQNIACCNVSHTFIIHCSTSCFLYKATQPNALSAELLGCQVQKVPVPLPTSLVDPVAVSICPFFQELFVNQNDMLLFFFQLYFYFVLMGQLVIWAAAIS